MTEIEILRAEIKTQDERIKELHALASGYSLMGTDACETCYQGRVTIFTANKQCTGCDPSGYEREEWVRRNSTIAKDATIKRLEKLLEEAEAVMVPVAAMFGWSDVADGMHDWIMSKNAYLAEHAIK